MDKRLLEVVTRFYEAAGDAAAWDEALVHFTALINAPTASIAVFDKRHQHYNLNAMVGVSPEAASAYESFFASIDPWFLRSMGRVSPGWVGPGEELCTVSELRTTQFYSDFLVPNDWLHECAAVLELSDGAVSALTMLRGPRQRPFHKAQLATVRMMVPHLQKALALHRRVVDLNATKHVNQWALDAVPYGVVIARADGTVLVANELAIAICAKSASLRLTTMRLSSLRRSENVVLQKAIHDAGNCHASSLSPVFALQQPDGSSLVVLVAPLRIPGVNGGVTSVAIFIHDTGRILLPPAEILTKVYNLTPSEARVAMAVGAGEPLREVSGRLGVSINTIRAQLKAALHKTRTARQADLARLLAGFPASPPRR